MFSSLLKKISTTDPKEALKDYEEVRVWDIQYLANENSGTLTRPQREEWLKEFLLAHEVQIRSFFREQVPQKKHEEDFLIYGMTDDKEEFIFGHPRRAQAKDFLKTFKPFCSLQIDIGPLDEVLEKLKQGQDKGKYQAVMSITPSSPDSHPHTAC